MKDNFDIAGLVRGIVFGFTQRGQLLRFFHPIFYGGTFIVKRFPVALHLICKWSFSRKKDLCNILRSENVKIQP